MSPTAALNRRPPTLLCASSDQSQKHSLNSVWQFPFLQLGNNDTQGCKELLPLSETSPQRQVEFPSLRQWNMLAGSRMPARFSIGHYPAQTPSDVWQFPALTPIFSVRDNVEPDR